MTVLEVLIWMKGGLWSLVLPLDCCEATDRLLFCMKSNSAMPGEVISRVANGHEDHEVDVAGVYRKYRQLPIVVHNHHRSPTTSSPPLLASLPS